MRRLLPLLVLAGCTADQNDPAKYGTYRVGIGECREPYVSWINEELRSLSSIGPTFVPGYGAFDFSVRCSETRSGSLGQYVLGDPEVVIDPAKSNGDEFAFKAAVGHELVHAVIWHGKHPDRASYHLCTWAYNDPTPLWCYPYKAVPNGLMFHTSGGIDAWDGSYESFHIANLPQYQPTPADLEFFRWAVEE